MIWKLNETNKIENIHLNLFDKNSDFIGSKTYYAYDESVFITDWFRKYHTRIVNENNIGSIGLYGSDFQHSNYISITNPNHHPNRWTFVKNSNLIETSIYFTVRHCIEATWLNDRDQFLFPNNGWETDSEFQNDCLAFSLFHGQNRISASEGINHWIPFTEQEVNAKEKFESNFMTQFIAGKSSSNPSKGGEQAHLFAEDTKVKLHDNQPKVFSEEAKAVFNAGRELWKYYHEIASLSRNDYNVNASFYDIRAHFQGRNDKGRMNAKSDDAKYSELIAALRQSLKILADKIKPKIYEFEFLKE